MKLGNASIAAREAGVVRTAALSKIQKVVVVFQPKLMGLPLRAILVHDAPIPPRMVQLLQMGKFMNNNVIDDSRRRHDQGLVEPDDARGRAASPPGLLFPDDDAPRIQTGEHGQFLRTSQEDAFRLTAVPEMKHLPHRRIAAVVPDVFRQGYVYPDFGDIHVHRAVAGIHDIQTITLSEKKHGGPVGPAEPRLTLLKVPEFIQFSDQPIRFFLNEERELVFRHARRRDLCEQHGQCGVE